MPMQMTTSKNNMRNKVAQDEIIEYFFITSKQNIIKIVANSTRAISA